MLSQCIFRLTLYISILWKLVQKKNIIVLYKVLIYQPKNWSASLSKWHYSFFQKQFLPPLWRRLLLTGLNENPVLLKELGSNSPKYPSIFSPTIIPQTQIVNYCWRETHLLLLKDLGQISLKGNPRSIFMKVLIYIHYIHTVEYIR